MKIDSLSYGRFVFFVTGNFHKFKEAQKIVSEFGISIAMLNIKVCEIQHNDIECIAFNCAQDASRKSKQLPVIVEDAGLFIDSLSGFPGPYSKYVFETIGIQGILKLLSHSKERTARFESVVAFSDPKGLIRCFRGSVEGRITHKAKGNQGFGFDPIFAPKGNSGKTFGEMEEKNKNLVSHRSQAFRKFLKWYRLKN